MGSFLSRQTSADSQPSIEVTNSMSNGNQNLPREDLDIPESSNTRSTRSLRRRRRPTCTDLPAPPARRRRLNLLIDTPSSISDLPANEHVLSESNNEPPLPPPPSLESASVSNQMVLGQTIEQVIYHVLEEQDYGRSRDDRLENGDREIQVFFYTGTFRIQLIPEEFINRRVTRSTTRFSISQVSAHQSSNNSTSSVPTSSSSSSSSPLMSNTSNNPPSSSSFMFRNIPRLRTVQREWITSTALRTNLRTETPVYIPPRHNQQGLYEVVDLPLVMLGTPDRSGSNPDNSSGWSLYVIGGGNTTDTVNRISSLARDTNTIPTVISSEGRLLMMIRPNTSRPSFAESMIVNSLGQLGEASSVMEGDQLRNQQQPPRPPTGQRSFGLLLAAVLSGMYDDSLTESALPLMNMILARDEEDGLSRDSYDLFWRLAGVLGPVVPRNISMEAVEQNLSTYKYEDYIKKANEDQKTAEDEHAKACPVCLMDYEMDSCLRVLPCTHFYHRECIDEWLSHHVNNCPLCRSVAVKTQPA